MKSCQLSVISCQSAFRRRRHGGEQFSRRVHAACFYPFSRRVHAACFYPFSRRVHAACSGWFGVRQIPNPQSLIPNPPRSAFTLVEMLVVVTIIGILAGLSFGALQMARETAREMATKATIAKLNNIIMRQYESYKTRRVPISTAGLTPRQSAEIRLTALREIMRMEMPERWTDIIDPCVSATDFTPVINAVLTISSSDGLASASLPRPALSRLYAQRYITLEPDSNGALDGYGPAECLYMLVSMGIPETIEQFHQSEIGDVDGDGYPEFVDGWGKPIMWLRWAPGFSSPDSDVQINDYNNHHDPFDTRRVDSDAFHLIPLIYSAGANGKYGINLSELYHFAAQQDPFIDLTIGEPTDFDGDYTDYQDNITNHHIEQR